MGIEPGDQATIEYTGRLTDEDEMVFDTSRERVTEGAGLTEAQPDRGVRADHGRARLGTAHRGV